MIACGARWPDGQLRPALEDLLGAGATLAHMEEPLLSPEAQTAAAAFRALQGDLPDVLRTCASGRALILKGFADDVDLAADLDASASAPVLQGGAYIAADERR